MRNFLFLKNLVRNHLINYPTPTNLNYFWGFGSSAGIFLCMQIVSGFFLSMHYSCDAVLAFASIEYITRVVNQGWLLRYVHSNGASIFMFLLYAHMWRSLYFRSYAADRSGVWIVGVIMFLLVVATAFSGYVLPWGQMSFWAATVITNLVSAIPYVGSDILYWLWGGFAVNKATLVRFFSLHFLLPFVIMAFVFVHLALLHIAESSNPLAVDTATDFIPFYPYFFLKDFFFFYWFFLYFVFLYFFTLIHYLIRIIVYFQIHLLRLAVLFLNDIFCLFILF